MNQLHPKVKILWRLQGYGPMVIFFLICIILIFDKDIQEYLNLNLLLFIPITFLLTLIILTEAYIKLGYSRWKYEITPTEVRLERGIIWKKYTSIPYEKIQNVDIHRNLFARILGFSTIEIETAGRSSSRYKPRRGILEPRQRYESEGHIPAVGVQDAEAIRDFIIKKIASSDDEGI
jgi:uncharacterized membrane protein YdbT with pleckstrin-like domain